MTWQRCPVCFRCIGENSGVLWENVVFIRQQHFRLYSSDQIYVTAELLPGFYLSKIVLNILIEIVQKLFNGMDRAKATKEKTKTVLNMILEMAVEDQLLPSNPLKSKRFKLSGAKSTTRACYTLDQMRYIVANIDRVKDPTERTYIAIQDHRLDRPA